MALCFAHSAAGYLVYEAARPVGRHRLGLLGASVVLAGAPDLDFVPGLLLGHPGAYHRGVTHTVVAALLVGAAVALGARLLRRGADPLRAGAWAVTAYGSHLLVDCLTVDAVAPFGLRLLWPLSSVHVLSPVTPLREIVIDGSAPAAFAASLLRPATLPSWLADAAVLVLAVLGVQGWRLWRARSVGRALPETSRPEACAP